MGKRENSSSSPEKIRRSNGNKIHDSMDGLSKAKTKENDKRRPSTADTGKINSGVIVSSLQLFKKQFTPQDSLDLEFDMQAKHGQHGHGHGILAMKGRKMENLGHLVVEIEEKCKILRDQITREKSDHKLQVKVDTLEETLRTSQHEILELQSEIRLMKEKRQLILELLNEGDIRTTSTTTNLHRRRSVHTQNYSQQHQVTVSTGIFKERDEFDDKDLRLLKIKTSRRVLLHGVGFHGPIDHDADYKVSVIVRANNPIVKGSDGGKEEIGRQTVTVRAKKDEKILVKFDDAIRLKAGKSYEIEYGLKGPRVENELSEKVPLKPKGRRKGRGRGTPHSSELRFNFSPYDKEKYTTTCESGVSFQVKQYKEEKGALCLLNYSIVRPALRLGRREAKKDGGGEDDDDNGHHHEDVEDEEEKEKNVYVTSEGYSESSSDEDGDDDDDDDDSDNKNKNNNDNDGAEE